MNLRNVNPIGDVDLPIVGRVVTAGEVFTVPDDIGTALLDQVGNYELVADAPPAPTPAPDVATDANTTEETK